MAIAVWQDALQTKNVGIMDPVHLYLGSPTACHVARLMTAVGVAIPVSQPRKGAHVRRGAVEMAIALLREKGA